MPKTAIVTTQASAPATPGVVLFSYDSLPADSAKMIQEVSDRIKSRHSRLMQDIADTGNDLIQVKSNLNHGEFEAWLNLEFGMTARSAQKYMKAAQWMADKNELSSLLAPNVVYLLSAKSTPKKVERKVIEELKSGVRVAPRKVRHLIQEARIERREADKKAQQNLQRTKGYRKRQEENRKKEGERLARADEAVMTAAVEMAKKIVEILRHNLTKDEIRQVLEGFGGGWDMKQQIIFALKDLMASRTDKESTKARKPRKKHTSSRPSPRRSAASL